jgi:hypothetical protein
MYKSEVSGKDKLNIKYDNNDNYEDDEVDSNNHIKQEDYQDEKFESDNEKKVDEKKPK